MPKLYITSNKENEYYTYSGTPKKPVYLTLTNEEIEAYLKKVTTSKIKSARSINENLIEVVIAENEIIVLDNIKVFKNEDRYSDYLKGLESNIKEALEKNNISTYKNNLPNEYIPKVIRGRKKEKYIVEDNNLATNIMLKNGYKQLDLDLSNIEMYNSEITRGR